MNNPDASQPPNRFIWFRHVPAFVQSHPSLALFLAAFIVRAAFILGSGALTPPVPWGDDFTYDRIAIRLASHHEYINTWYPPGYPLFLALIYTVFGQSWLAVRVIQAALSAGTCALTAQLGTRLFSQRSGNLAGWLLALYPGHAYIAWRLMAETPYMFLLVLSIGLAHKLATAPGTWRAVVLGITVGFAQLIKSNLFLFPPLLMLWFVFAARGKPRWLVSLAALLVSFAVVQLITPLVNRLSPGGKAALLPSNAGHTLWYSNNPLADGYFTCAEALPAGQAFIERHGYTQRLKGADLFEEDRLYRTLALLWIRENPGRFLVLGLKKLNNAFGLFPRAVVFEGKPTARAVHLLTYGLLAPLMLAGLAVTFRRWRDLLLLYAVLFSFVVMVVLFYGTPRFTIVIIPFLLLFASSALWMCRDRLTSAK